MSIATIDRKRVAALLLGLAFVFVLRAPIAQAAPSHCNMPTHSEAYQKHCTGGSGDTEESSEDTTEETETETELEDTTETETETELEDTTETEETELTELEDTTEPELTELEDTTERQLTELEDTTEPSLVDTTDGDYEAPEQSMDEAVEETVEETVDVTTNHTVVDTKRSDKILVDDSAEESDVAEGQSLVVEADYDGTPQIFTVASDWMHPEVLPLAVARGTVPTSQGPSGVLLVLFGLLSAFLSVLLRRLNDHG